MNTPYAKWYLLKRKRAREGYGLTADSTLYTADKLWSQFDALNKTLETQ